MFLSDWPRFLSDWPVLSVDTSYQPQNQSNVDYLTCPPSLKVSTSLSNCMERRHSYNVHFMYVIHIWYECYGKYRKVTWDILADLDPELKGEFKEFLCKSLGHRAQVCCCCLPVYCSWDTLKYEHGLWNSSPEQHKDCLSPCNVYTVCVVCLAAKNLSKTPNTEQTPNMYYFDKEQV